MWTRRRWRNKTANIFFFLKRVALNTIHVFRLFLNALLLPKFYTLQRVKHPCFTKLKKNWVYFYCFQNLCARITKLKGFFLCVCVLIIKTFIPGEHLEWNFTPVFLELGSQFGESNNKWYDFSWIYFGQSTQTQLKSSSEITHFSDHEKREKNSNFSDNFNVFLIIENYPS